jgi:hypothetical protein
VRAGGLHAGTAIGPEQQGDGAMKRLHVHVTVERLSEAIGFYSTLFAAEPAIVKPDYAKWMLDDPRVNFAISTRSKVPGVDHLGIQVEDDAELSDVSARLDTAQRPVFAEGQTTCCYAHSEKSWIEDPAGIAWEVFLTTGESTVYGKSRRKDSGEAQIAHADPCCGPQASLPAQTTCCR